MAPVDVFDRVATVLADSLGIEQAEIQPGSHLENDLGMDSLDLLDVLYRLEGEFAIRVEREDLFPDFLFQYRKSIGADGLTDSARTEIQRCFPFLGLKEVMALPDLKSLLTVRVLVGSVEHRLERAADSAHDADIPAESRSCGTRGD
jgi:acyl carrier protein